MAGLSVFAISGVLSLKEQEKEHYAELVLSRAVSRGRWMTSYLAVVFIGSALILLSLGISTGLGWSIAAGDFSYLIRVLGMSLSKLPSVWMIVGVSAMLYGWVPRFSGIFSWMILGIFILIEMMWEAGLVGWSVLKLTPFAYAHYTIPIEKVAIFPLLALILISILTVWVGIKGFSKRSIQ
jgi:ABC-2 type transport system permease protein